MKLKLKTCYLLASIIALSIASCKNECKDLACLNGGECDRKSGTCECPEGFSGKACQIEDECITKGVECVNGDCSNAVCICEKNFFGPTCEDYCINGAYDPDSRRCACEADYYGLACEFYCPNGSFDKEKSKCVCENGTYNSTTLSCNCDAFYYGEQCENHCVNGTYANGTCTCDWGYYGLDCSMADRDKFLGNYDVTGDCYSGSTSFSSIIYPSDASVFEVFISRLADIQEPILANVNSTSIQVPFQEIGNYSIYGNGYISGNTIVLSFEYYDNFGLNEFCDVVFKK